MDAGLNKLVANANTSLGDFYTVSPYKECRMVMQDFARRRDQRISL